MPPLRKPGEGVGCDEPAKLVQRHSWHASPRSFGNPPVTGPRGNALHFVVAKVAQACRPLVAPRKHSVAPGWLTERRAAANARGRAGPKRPPNLFVRCNGMLGFSSGDARNCFQHVLSSGSGLHPTREATGQARIPVWSALAQDSSYVRVEEGQMFAVVGPKDLATHVGAQPKGQPEIWIRRAPKAHSGARPGFERHRATGAEDFDNTRFRQETHGSPTQPLFAAGAPTARATSHL